MTADLHAAAIYDRLYHRLDMDAVRRQFGEQLKPFRIEKHVIKVVVRPKRKKPQPCRPTAGYARA
jgi:hypothetical protein